MSHNLPSIAPNTVHPLANSTAASLGFSSEAELVAALRRSFVTFSNPLLATDVYKMGHMEQIKKGATKIVAYIYARSNREYPYMVSAGLTHILRTYLARRLTPQMGEEFLENKKAIVTLAKATASTVAESEAKIRALCALGYIPLEIRAVPEGTVLPVPNMVATVTNTLPEFAWCVGFFESLLLKIFDAMSTASCVFAYRRLVDHYFDLTVTPEQDFLRDFMIHDFGYRGCGTEEAAQITGVAQLLLSSGSDTVPAREYAIRMYGAERDSVIMLSPPASEHAVACSYGTHPAGEIDYLRSMLGIYPEGIVSLVSDTINVYELVTSRAEAVKDLILAREGKTVFRPDSGNPPNVLCGDEGAPAGSKERVGVIRLLEGQFGHTRNAKGYTLLNQKVGLIYGDGMYLKRYAQTLERMRQMEYAASTLVIGVGGILRMHSRDTLGLTLKDVYMVIDGVPTNIQKDPITDPGKKSHCGLPALRRNEAGSLYTVDGCTEEEFGASETELVYRDGQLYNLPAFAEMRARAQAGLKQYPLTQLELDALLA